MDDITVYNFTPEMTFYVYGDDVLLYSSSPLKASDPAETINVDVTGVQELQLRVSCSSYNNYNYEAYGSWSGAYLIPPATYLPPADDPTVEDPFYGGTPGGEIVGEVNPDPALDSMQYAGEYYDAETGLIYLRNRYYDPNSRRFTQEDPAREEWNWYAYCDSDPINFIDPFGLWKHTDDGFEAEEGDSLWSLSELLFGDGRRWTELGFEGEPGSLQAGQVIGVDATVIYYFYGSDQKSHATSNIKGLRDDGFAVIGHHITSTSDFTKAYNAMPGTVNTVIANLHGNPSYVSYINLSRLDMTKSIGTFVLLSCNAGHQWTGSESFASKIANAGRGNIGQLIAADGTHFRGRFLNPIRGIKVEADSTWKGYIDSSLTGTAKSKGFIRYKWNGTSYDKDSLGNSFSSVRKLLKKVGV